MKELPEIEDRINDGRLNLTHFCLVQSLFKREEKLEHCYSSFQKVEILEKLENTSKREAEKIALRLSSRPSGIITQEKIRALSQDDLEIKFVKKELLKKIEKLKALLSHKYPDLKLPRFTL